MGFQPSGNYASAASSGQSYPYQTHNHDHNNTNSYVGHRSNLGQSNEHNGIDHDSLQQIFSLSDTKLALAKDILEMNQENITAALVYGLISLKHDTSSATSTNIPAPSPAAGPVAAPATNPGIGSFHYSDYIKAYRTQLRCNTSHQGISLDLVLLVKVF